MADRAWELFPHDADVGVRGRGPTPAAAFEQAALALTAALTDPVTVLPTRSVEIACRSADPEMLLVDWLNALIFEMATRRMLFSRFEVTIEGALLTAAAWGEPIDLERHRLSAEAKGATFTALGVRQDAAGGWVAQCVVDV